MVKPLLTQASRKIFPAVITFTPDVTRPRWSGTGVATNNVGCLIGVSRTTVASVTQAADAVWENLTITGQVTITQPRQTFRNCRFTYSYVGDNGGGIVYQMTSGTNNQQTLFEFCEFEPTTPNDRYNGVYGHDFKLYRCAISKCVDGFGVYNSTDDTCNVEVASCWIGNMAWVVDDYTPSRPNGHSDLTGTHNDGIQLGSGTNILVHGNFWNQAKYNIANPTNVTLNSDGMTYTLAPGNGVNVLTSTPSGSAAINGTQAGQVFLGQHSAYNHVGDITFIKNWCWNFDAGFKLSSNRTSSVAPELRAGRSAITTVVFTDNLFGGTPRYISNSNPYVPVRFDTNCIINGRNFAGPTSGQQFAYDTNNNRWDAANTTLTGPTTWIDGTPILANLVRYMIDNVPLPD